MNYKKRESVAISILHEEIHVNFKKEIGDPEQKWNNGLKTEISFMPNQILFSKENKHKGTLKKLKYNLEKDSFIGQTSYKKNNVELGLENHNGNLNWIFKTSEELISKFKNILKNG